MYSIRAANIDDLDWISDELKKFSDLYPSKHKLFGESARSGIENLIANQVFLICEYNNERAGLIAGILTNHFLNPSLIVLIELFWWVSEPYRKTRAGLLLLEEFSRIGKERANWITMSLSVNSELKDSSLIKRGFDLKEKQFILEV